MRFSLLSFVAVAAHLAFGAVEITDPNNTTKCSGGETCVINWRDNAMAPPLNASGTCDFSIYTGNPGDQTRLQTIKPDVAVAEESALQFTVDPKIGPSGNFYFIRAQCSVQDPADPTLPLLSFSGFFSLDKMTGRFNDTVNQQIQGIPNTSLPGGTLSGFSTQPPAPTSTGTTSSNPATLTSTTTSPRSSGTGNPRDNNDAALAVVAGPAAFLITGAVALYQLF
jgi:hypothetical protein